MYGGEVLERCVVPREAGEVDDVVGWAVEWLWLRVRMAW